MKILVVGSGGREHAIAWRLAQDAEEHEIYCAPGNAGTLDVATNVAIKADDLEGLTAWAEAEKPDLVVVGPEAPLVAGLVDALAKVGVPAFGPVAAGARLEGSKRFAKEIMDAAGVPTGKAEVFTDAAKAKAALPDYGLPVVIIANRAQTIESDGRLKSGGILYKEGIVKIRRIASAANDDGIPTIWIQDVAGFDIGAQAERDGLLRLGAGILHEIASDERDTPAAMTIVLRKASGAGYYAMKGSPFHPAWTVVTAITRMEVMRSDVLASALYDKKISKIDGEIKARQIKDGLALDCAEIAQLARNRDELVEARTALASAQNDNAQPRAALARGDADSFVALSQLRRAIVDFLHAAWQEQRIVRPKRLWGIWSL